jgi:hypothetical protein
MRYVRTSLGSRRREGALRVEGKQRRERERKSRRVMCGPKTRAPKIRNDLSSEVGWQAPVSHALTIRHVTNVAAY